MTHPAPNIPQAPPLTLYYQGKPVRVLLHHGHCCLLADDILALSPPRLRHQLQQQLAEYPSCHLTLPPHDSPRGKTGVAGRGGRAAGTKPGCLMSPTANAQHGAGSAH